MRDFRPRRIYGACSDPLDGGWILLSASFLRSRQQTDPETGAALPPTPGISFGELFDFLDTDPAGRAIFEDELFADDLAADEDDDASGPAGST